MTTYTNINKQSISNSAVCVCLCAEARGLVRALLQPDPTVRLTAEQTLLHPWVKAMASICRQRALTDQTQRNTAGTGAEPVQRLAQTNAAATMTDKTPGYSSNEGEITHIECSRRDEMNTGRGQDEDKPAQQQSSTLHTRSPQFKVHTPSEATPGQQRPDCTSTDSGSPSRESNCDPGSPTSPSVELHQLSAPAAQTEPPSQIRTQSEQNSQQHPSLNPAAASSPHPLHQQNFTSPLHNPAKAQNPPAENYDEPNVPTTTTHPPTQS